MTRTFINSILIVITAMTLGGCALTEDKINLEYVPMAEVSKIEGANLTEVSVNVTDNRTIKDRVSCKKNGYGMEMASILSNNDVIELVESSIEEELKNRGFMIADGSVRVEVELNKFYNDFKLGFFAGEAVSEIFMNVQVQQPDNDIKYTKSIKGAYIEKGIQLLSGKNAKISLDAALQDAIAKLMDDASFIDALLKASTKNKEKN